VDTVDKFNDPLDNNPFRAPLDWEKFDKQAGGLFLKFVNEYVFTRVFKSLFIVSVKNINPAIII
jgi:hypothetical protein